MISRTASLVVKELLQFFRDPLLVLVIVLGPILQITIIDSGGPGGGANIPTAVIDQDRTSVSRELIESLENTRDLIVAAYPVSLEEAQLLIDRGDVRAVVVIPPGFASDIRGGETAPVQLILDGTNVLVAGDAQRAAQGAIETLGWQIVLSSLPAGGGASIELREQPLYNASLDDLFYRVTAQMAFFTFIVVALGGVMGVVKEREVGTIEQIMITPLQQVELILGKAFPPAILGQVTFTALFMISRFLYDVPVRGSLLLLGALTALYLTAEVCVSLMISTFSRTQAQAITVVFVWVMVGLTLSGFLVPISSLPPVLQFIANLLPLQHFIEINRNVLIKGVGVEALLPQILSLAGLTIVVVIVTALMLRRLGK
ncbi:MAG: ABC transporter permease [Chloroflexi bacterium]|nr:ABC transporter permease [Chloroflexota bacterium]